MNDVTLNDFTSYFKNEIYPYTLKYEKHRIFAKIMSNIIMPIAFIALYGSIPFSKGFTGNWFAYILGGITGFFGIYFVFTCFVNMKYVKKVKKEILPNVLKFINMKVGDGKSVSDKIKNRISSLHIFPYFQDCKCDDYIIGEYKGIKLEIYDIRLTKTQRYGKHSKTITVFNGAYVCLPNPNLPKAVIVVDLPSADSSLERIPIENKTFNLEYSAFSNNPNEAVNFLTPEVIKEIIKYTKLNDNIYFSFEKNKLNLKICSYWDLFEVSFEKSPSDITNYVSIINEIEAVYERLDFILALNSNKIKEN